MRLYLTFLHPLYTQSLVLLAYCESISVSGIFLSSFSGLIFSVSLPLGFLYLPVIVTISSILGKSGPSFYS